MAEPGAGEGASRALEEVISRPDQQIAAFLAQGRYDRGWNLGSYGTQASLLDEGTQPEDGIEHVVMWYKGLINRHGATNISEYEMAPVNNALATRCLKNTFLRSSLMRVEGLLAYYSDAIESESNPALVSAVAKQLAYEKKENKRSLAEYSKYKAVKKAAKERVEPYKGNTERISWSPNMTPDEGREYMKYETAFKVVDTRCRNMSELGEVMQAYIKYRLSICERESLKKHINDVVEPADRPSVELEIQEEIDTLKDKEVRLTNEIIIRSGILNETADPKKDPETNKWVSIVKAHLGMQALLNAAAQWQTNQSDLDPISRLWENQGRMVEIHPSQLKEMVENLPSFNEAFKAIAAISTGKYALGMNGEIYISGRYDMGYVGTDGKLVDVDDGRSLGIKPLEKNQILVNGVALNPIRLEKRPNLNKPGEEILVGGFYLINGEEKFVYTRNILYDKLQDQDIDENVNKLIEFLRNRDKKSSDLEIEVGVELARNFFEMSMLSNWYGVPRDSVGRPYYKDFDFLGVKGNGQPDYEKKGYMSSNPDSVAVREGIFAEGWDEGSLFPYWIADWGKLTLTRGKQMAETGKGRKHGLYPLISHLPESLAKPLISREDIDGLISGKKIKKEVKIGDKVELKDVEMTMGDVFDKMSAMERFKTFWLDIAKGIAVYEFVSSCFVGDKDTSKADAELMVMMMQPRFWEALNKNIDLSVIYVDPMEAARLKVNIVVAALAAVSSDARMKEFLSIGPRGIVDGKIEKILKVTKNSLGNFGDAEPIVRMLQQLVASRFIGGEEEVLKVIKRLDDFNSGRVSDVCFSMTDFKKEYGSDYLKQNQLKKEERRRIVARR